MHFRDAETGEWHMITDKKYAYLSSKWTTDEERIEYNKLELFPLHDVGDSDRALIVMREKTERTNIHDAIFALPVSSGKMQEIQGETDGIAVETERYILVSPLMPENGYIYDTIGKLAMQLRADELTDRHLELYEKLKTEVGNSSETLQTKMQENIEFKASVDGLRAKMKVMTLQVIEEDGRFVESVKTYFGSSFLEDVWGLIQDWFNHDFLGRKLSDEQLWYVD
jgi:hypothetical protein